MRTILFLKDCSLKLINVDKLAILKDLKSNLQKQYRDSVKDVILFGSQATGNSNENSDYDVLIILEKKYNGQDENKILDICYAIDLKYNILIDVHLLSKNELSTLRGKQSIFVKALNYGIYA